MSAPFLQGSLPVDLAESLAAREREEDALEAWTRELDSRRYWQSERAGVIYRAREDNDA